MPKCSIFRRKSIRDRQKNVSPVLYLNNYGDSLDALVYALGDIVSQDEYSRELHRLFPLLSCAGNKLTPRGGIRTLGIYDFSREREWRLPLCYSSLEIDFDNDVFIGLCPNEEIDCFEDFTERELDRRVLFIDPIRNAKWYVKKLTECRRQFNLTSSVV